MVIPELFGASLNRFCAMIRKNILWLTVGNESVAHLPKENNDK